MKQFVEMMLNPPTIAPPPLPIKKKPIVRTARHWVRTIVLKIFSDCGEFCAADVTNVVNGIKTRQYAQDLVKHMARVGELRRLRVGVYEVVEKNYEELLLNEVREINFAELAKVKARPRIVKLSKYVVIKDDA